MRTHRLAVAVVLLLVPVVPAAPDAPLAAGVSTAGDYVLEGGLAALRHLAPAAGADPGLGLHIRAASIVVEEETQGGVYTSTPDGNEASLVEAREERRTRVVEDALVEEVEARPGRDVSVLAVDARVVATGEGAAWVPSERATVKALDVVEFDDRDPRVPVRHTVQVEGAPAVTVTGHFLVLVWDMDLAVEGHDGRRTHSAGRTEEFGTAPYEVPDADGPSNGNSTELVLEVLDGTLHLGPGAGEAWFHVTEPALQLSSARLDGVTGALPAALGGLPVDGSILDLRGDLRLALDAPAGDALSWGLGGRIDDARLDGHALAVVAPLAGGPSVRSWLPWTTALSILGVGGLPLHRLRARRRLEDAELLLAAGHFQAAAEVARSPPLGGVRVQAAALRVQALLEAGRGEEARRLAPAATRRTDRVLAGLVQATVEDWEGGT